MSSESTPVLDGALPSFEMFIMQWESLAINTPHCTPYIKVGLEWAQDH